MLQFIKKNLKGTKLIFVVGLSASGKTTLLGDITNQKLKVGHSINSGTLNCQVLPAVVHGEQYLFVDTPGFGAKDLDDRDVYQDIMDCVCTLSQWVTIAGVMFVHDMRMQRLTRSEMKTIRWLECFCGPQFFENITIVLTQWDRITPDDMDQARDIAKEFETSAFKNILLPTHVEGGRIYNHGINTGSGEEWDAFPMKSCQRERYSMAADFIRDHYGRNDGVARLQVLQELANGCGIYETEAAASLFNAISSPTTLQQKAFVMDVDKKLTPKVKEMEAADEPKPPNQKPAPGVSTTTWREIAKVAAWVFWGFRRTGKTKYTEYTQSTTTGVWQRLKTWWSGEAPPL